MYRLYYSYVNEITGRRTSWSDKRSIVCTSLDNLQLQIASYSTNPYFAKRRITFRFVQL